ncbi:MAG: CinA family protein [Gammaproteobacteria bacterium]|nr:CinA family protein [Gammaproteobacteria bacterium]MYA35088.1 CinA family protein [Gammaproteobacteria bacterium]MYH85968.1 CinA family protein [Gammaproteobacteria bacterium]MYK03590.1 CinA family protein [Gammaproteobacteria bacterium]
MRSNEQLERLSTRVGERLLARKLLLAAAESCTGGWVAEAITAVAGSSAWFDCGFVTYSNEAKQRLLDVPANLLEFGGPGAVSEETVLAMTEGAIANSRARVAVAVSGVAGPDGGSADKPVGTVWIAWQWEKRRLARKFHFGGDRTAVREAAVLASLEGLLALLD